MDELITKHLNGLTTDIESRTLEKWCEESPENEAVFRELSALWALSTAEESQASRPPAVEDLVQRAEQRRRSARRSWSAALRSPWSGYGLAAAAVVALFFAVRGDEQIERPLLTPVESSASAADVVTMSLSDGSVVRLAPSTTVEFPPSAEQRLVVLSGRAFFAVVPDEAPFVVRASGGEVTVLGTRFEVSTTDDGLRVVVVEGTVTARGGGQAVRVEAGYAAHIGTGGEVRVERTEDVWTLLEWTDGLLVFQETPLADVAVELGRHFGLEVAVSEDVADRRITAWFSDEPLDAVVAAVCLVAGAVCEVGDEGVTVGDLNP